MLNTKTNIKNSVLQGGNQILQNSKTSVNTVPAIINNFNIIDNKTGGDSTIIVEHDKNTHEFTFKTVNKNILGSFNILQLFKFLNNDCESYLTDINIGTSDTIITKYLYNPTDNTFNTCDLISHLDSPFTGNIELLVKLYADIIKIEDKINEEILTKPREIAEKIKEKNNRFIYNILIRILKLANTLTEQFKNDQSKRDILIKYSVGAAYKLSIMTQDDLSIKKMQYENIQTDIEKLKKIQETINSKLDLLNQTIEIENKNINVLITHLSNKHIMQGGNKSSSSKQQSLSEQSTSKQSTSKQSLSTDLSSTSYTSISHNNTSDTSFVNKEKINKHKDLNKSSSISTDLSLSSVKQKYSSSDLNINDIHNEANQTEKTRSLIKSINVSSSYESSYDTFTITD